MRATLVGYVVVGVGLVTTSWCLDVPVPMVALAKGADCACTELATNFNSTSLLFANATDYKNEIFAYWDKRAVMEPKCIVFPSTADEVASTMKTIYSCKAQFAVRGGGHMNNPGSNNIQDGILVAFNNMKTLKLSSDKETIHTGPGATWVDVYEYLAPHSLYAIGGRLKTIGVAGLELIGGFHYFNNKYGMAMDNVVSYDVVLGNGTQVVANAHSHRELFWALKGGSSNYGIVTNFEVKTHRIPKISTTTQLFDASAVDAFIDATVEFAQQGGPDVAAGAVITIGYNATTKEASCTLLGVQEGTESPPSKFDSFSRIPTSTATRQNSVLRPIDWHANLDTPFQMSRVQFGHGTMKPDAAQLKRIFQSWTEAVGAIADVEGLNPTFVMNVLPSSALQVGKKNGIGNTWDGLDANENYILWQLATNWDNAIDDIRLTNWARQFIDHWEADNTERGLSRRFLYAGDSGEFQDVYASSFPADILGEMSRIRDAYDPAHVFSRLNWGGFKLPSP